jgi:ribosomal protein S14
VPDDLRPIKLFDSTHDALLARDALAANGIQAVLSSGRVARKGWSPDGHLIQLSVSQNDVHAAEAFFAEADAIAKLHARERCPRCGSPHVTRVTTRRLALLPWIRRRDPLFRMRSGWRCGHCGRFSETAIR